VHLLFVGGFLMFSIFVVKNRICDPVIPAKGTVAKVVFWRYIGSDCYESQ
jgi:hypothetical protein